MPARLRRKGGDGGYGLVTWQELLPNPDDRMLALGGVAYAEPAAASCAYPDEWRTPSAARMARERWRTSPYEQSLSDSAERGNRLPMGDARIPNPAHTRVRRTRHS